MISRGLTLVALAVLAMGPACNPMKKAQIKSATTSACALRVAAELALAEDGACPTPEALVSKKRIANAEPDPWGHAFHISCSADDVTVSSDGPDGRPNTDDDVRVKQGDCSALR